MDYLTKQLSNYIDTNTNTNYRYTFNKIRLKRFISQAAVVFICQYIAIMQTAFTYPAPPMYPPMGVGFVMIYLFGGSALLPLFIAGSSAYFFKGLPLAATLPYLIADIGVNWVGVYFCQNTFHSQNPHANNAQEWIHFIAINALFTCLLSSLMRSLPIILKMQLIDSLYYFIELWLANLNGVLVLFGFAISWLSWVYSRGPITTAAVQKGPIIVLAIFILLSLIFIKRLDAIYLLITSMLLSLYMASRYGHLIATILLYFTSYLYVSYFIIHNAVIIGFFPYVFVPILLFLYCISMLLLC